MEIESAVNPELHPYGTWYSKPGGLLFERDDRNDNDARNRLKVLRARPADEPRYSHKKVAITYAVIGLMHLPLAFFNLGIKSTVKDIDAGDWAGFGFVMLIVLLFVGLAAKNAIRPPQRTAYSMLKGYLAAAIGLSRGRAFSMLLRHDRTERLRTPPPPQVDDGSDDEPLPFNDQNKFERYWLNAFGGGWHPWKTIKLRDVQSVELAADLALMQADVKVTLRSLVAQFLAIIPILIGTVLSTIAFAILFIVILSSRPESEGIVYWLIPIAAPVALGLLAGIAMFIRSLVPIGHKSFPIRKLLVRVNGQWRVFNGELQGADETDVRWAIDISENVE